MSPPDDTAAALPANIDEMNAANVAGLFADPPEGTDLQAVLRYEAERDEPRSTVLKAAVKANLIDDEQAKQIVAQAEARHAQPADDTPRHSAERIRSNPDLIGGGFSRAQIVAAFTSAGVEDLDEFSADEAAELIGRELDKPLNDATKEA